jgi:catechol 2,3-dioxygenase-like lactoylglutathione lyase family enzyme
VINHLSLGVPQLERAATFYDAVLLPLGYVRVWTAPDAVGYGLLDGSDEFAIKFQAEGSAAPHAGFHVAFTAPSRASVEQFHATALRHGAADNGAPALRTDYGPYYTTTPRSSSTRMDTISRQSSMIAPERSCRQIAD